LPPPLPTPEPDFFAAGDGNDVILGRGGDDLVCAGLGNDGVAVGATPATRNGNR
jgi:hypothetical protein